VEWKVTRTTLSESCAGSTRASMMSGSTDGPYVRLRLRNVIMDCRVEPGNDNREAANALMALARDDSGERHARP